MSIDPNNKMIMLEQPKRFSESCLWRLQRDYFDKAGIDAWVNQVPFYITSNPFIANSYAQIVVRFIRDWLQLHPEAKQHPFYILELGTGSGRFSYYVIKRIVELLQTLGMTDVSVCYVMSDFTKHNIAYYETHPALLPYIKQGLVDFALFDMEQQDSIVLQKLNKKLDQSLLVNQLITFANYIFDTISHDAFTVRDGQLCELLVSTATTADNLQDNKPIDMRQLVIDYKTQVIDTDYYDDAVLNAILEDYKDELTHSSFLIPIGSIRAIQLLKHLSTDKLFIIASDKGYNSSKSLNHLSHPAITFHGSFSMMVNFHALACYFKQTGGDAFLQTPRKGIKTAIFCSGFELRDLPETILAIEQYIEGTSAADYFTLHRRVSDSFNDYSLETIAAHLQFSQWDPHIYSKLSNRIVALTEEADLDSIQFIADNLHKLAKNYYFMPQSECVLFEIAVFFHAIKRYRDALHYYIEAQAYVGQQFSLFYNMALCQHHLNLIDEALVNFKLALEIDQSSKEALEWITYLEKDS